MSDDLRRQIHNNMDLKDTEELLNIWVTNNQSVWTDDAIKVVEEILRKRNIELPLREASMNEKMEDEEAKYNPEDFTEEERKIMGDENPPEFYNPFEVISTSRQLKWAARAMVVFYTITQLMRYPSIKKTVYLYFSAEPFQTVTFHWLIDSVSLITMVVLIAAEATVIYFMLTGFSYILKILMEMEFNSRTNK